MARNLGVVGGLVLLAFELRQNTNLLRAQAVTNRLTGPASSGAVLGVQAKGVQVLFHSYHAGHVPAKRMRALEGDVGVAFQRYNNGSTLPGITMPATVQAAAANYMWISCNNTSARESCWPSFFVRPDGVTTGRLRLNTAGVLISRLDTNERLYDSTPRMARPRHARRAPQWNAGSGSPLEGPQATMTGEAVVATHRR